jgi:hypothetical protein
MCLAALGVCLSGAALAAPPAPERVVHDVALANGGVFAGQLVDAQNVAKVGERVTLLYESRPLATTATDQRGNFAFRGLRGGMYQVAAAGRVEGYRLWAPETAPKGVPTAALLVGDDSLVRGQYYNYQYQRGMLPGIPPARYLLANPWVVAGVAATAVAVPVGIAAADSGNVPTSP